MGTVVLVLFAVFGLFIVFRIVVERLRAQVLVQRLPNVVGHVTRLVKKEQVDVVIEKEPTAGWEDMPAVTWRLRSPELNLFFVQTVKKDGKKVISLDAFVPEQDDRLLVTKSGDNIVAVTLNGCRLNSQGERVQVMYLAKLLFEDIRQRILAQHPEADLK